MNTDSQEKLHDIIITVKEVSEAKDLTTNVDKTEMIVIGKKMQVLTYNVRINNKII